MRQAPLSIRSKRVVATEPSLSELIQAVGRADKRAIDQLYGKRVGVAPLQRDPIKRTGEIRSAHETTIRHAMHRLKSRCAKSIKMMQRQSMRAGKCSFAMAATIFLAGPFASAQRSDRDSSDVTMQSDAPKATRSLPLFYDSALAAKGFPNPLLRAMIAGHEALFIVDTGTSANLLAAWFSEAAAIPSRPLQDSTMNSSGGAASVGRLTDRLEGHWTNGRQFALRAAMVVSMPSYFESMHIGGLVSPQLLAPLGMATVMDLKTPSLQFMPFAHAVAQLKLAKKQMDELSLKQDCQTEAAEHLYLAPVTTAGITDLMLIDTGATKTIFFEGSSIAHEIEGRSEVGSKFEGIGGGPKDQRIVRHIQLLRGGRIVDLDPSIGQGAAPCGAKGLLGMDALRGCVLILDHERMVFSCA